ncbi:ABC-type transporter, ATPase and permease components [Cupriavidus taiwanensis]|nr:ABC-type transporter, ATPase and permease components [Cupriavidus taiwanensis]SOY50861.1 ABC-type transporter, ATPase and permease components [Cupriavidus taiwanensis]SOY83739.1 ABC-type transporter, ATPase and permease components [Cupriavidus taiwanensis]SOZ57979.1 ABC-type transporter, ATPase and permease components [Cupriavidus taiwanensis]SOZ79777.1 ABC-type transporter, ATPase and permease components [Cupriavidus taiwanensis]
MQQRLFVALCAALSTLVPYLLREATNALSVDAAHGAIGYPLLLAAAYGLAWTTARAFDWLKFMLSAVVLARCDAAFHHAILATLIRVDYPRLTAKDPGKLVSVIARSRAAFRAITFAVFWAIAPTVLQLVLSSLLLWKLTGGAFALGFAISMSLLFAATWFLADKSKSAHEEIFSGADMLSSHLVEKLGFILDIKLNNAYTREDAALHRTLAVYIGKVTRGNTRLALLLVAQAICTGLLLTLFTVTTAYGVIHSTFRAGDFVMIASSIVTLAIPFTNLAGSLSDLRRNHLALRESFGLLELPIERSESSVRIDRTANEVIRIEHAVVKQGESQILQDVNITVSQGELVALVGPSGAGKSSLAHLMLGLSRPAAGTVFLLGADVSKLAVSDIARAVAVAPQAPMILTGSLRENLIYGCDSPPSDHALRELVALLELQGIAADGHCDILDRPLGIQGRALSGGERQRVALGRALARRPAVIILDEPTSAIDPDREARIFARVRQQVPTVIVVTHRDALVRMADRVYRVANGTVQADSPSIANAAG